MNDSRKWFLLTSAVLLAGCASTTQLSDGCGSTVENASYTGPYRGPDDRLTAEELARDLRCAAKFKAEKHPRGFVAIYGSSRIRESNSQADPSIKAANDAIYREVYKFAKGWTEKYGRQWPVLTGGGTGLMEAAARGAVDAGGSSIGYTTYYGDSRDHGGQPEKAFATYSAVDGTKQKIITDGLIFSSVGIREYAMFLHSTAVVLAPGGSGTEWEMFQILESIKSGQLGPIPVYLLGPKTPHWDSFYARLEDMAKRGTVRPNEVEQHFQHVETAEQLIGLAGPKLIHASANK